MVKIQLNGKIVSFRTKLSILDLLKKYKIINKQVAVEHNGVIISKRSYKNSYLKENDRVEIVHFIGGG